MGVKTKVFGYYAWLLLEGLSKYYDSYISQEKEKILRFNMTSYLKELFFLLGFVLPCIFCRISYQEFTDPEKPDPSTDLLYMLTLKDGAKKFVYNLHARVSCKLQYQELESLSPSDEKQIQEVLKKWKKHNITYEEALRMKFPDISSEVFWHALIVFMALVMCDFREEYSCYIFRFFWVIGKMLSLSGHPDDKPIVRAYILGLEQTLPLWRVDMKFSERLDIVWTIKKLVFTVQDWKFSHSRQSFEEKCKASVVGCRPK